MRVERLVSRGSSEMVDDDGFMSWDDTAYDAELSDGGCSAFDDAIMPDSEGLKQICNAFEKGVKLTHRWKYHLRHNKCAPVFSGCDAVSFIVDNGYARSREKALRIGREMAYEFALFWHETRDFDLEDDKNRFYNFTPPVQRFITTSQNLKLHAIAEEFEEGLAVGPNTYKNKSYKNTFVGVTAVTLLVSSQMAKTRQDAVRVGQLLMDKFGMFQPVSKKHKKFKDKDLLYRFVPEKQRVNDCQMDYQYAIPIEEKAQLFREIVTPGYSFSGSSAVDAMVDGGVVTSRTEAVLLGEKLASDLQLFHCVLGEGKAFFDRPDVYYAYYQGRKMEFQDSKELGGQAANGGDTDNNLVEELEVVMRIQNSHKDRSTIAMKATKNTEGYPIVAGNDRRDVGGEAFHLEDRVVLRGESEEMQSQNNAKESPNDMTQMPMQHPARLFDRFGFILEKDEYSSGASAVSSDCNDTIKTTEKELSVEEWRDLLDSCALTDSGAPPMASLNRVKYFMRIGLPDSLRRKAWTVITGVDAVVREREGDYQALVETATRLMDDENEEHVLLKVIDRDLHRTFPRHFLFCTQNDPSDNIAFNENSVEKLIPDGLVSLRRVLYAYSIYDNEIGYCQGMNFIAAMFLTFLSEEESFWLLVAVMNEQPYGMRELFSEDMAGVHETLHVAKRVIQKFLPKLYRHLKKEQVDVSMVVTQWIMTVFTNTFPFDLVSCVWDSFIVEGWKVVYRVMLSLLDHAQQDLLDRDLEHILSYLRDEFTSKVDGPSIVKASLKIPLRQRQIRKYSTEWRVAQNGHNTNFGRKASVGSATSSQVSVKQRIGLQGVGANGKQMAKKLLPALG